MSLVSKQMCPTTPLLQRWHVHRILRAFHGNFFTVNSWEEDARGKSHSCLFTDPRVSPILVDLRFFFKTCTRLAEQNQASLCCR